MLTTGNIYELGNTIAETVDFGRNTCIMDNG